MRTIIAAHSGVLRGTGESILSALSNLSSLPWIARSKIERHLQMLSVLQWVVSFLMLGIVCSIILFYTFFTNCWPIAALYLSWLILDWDTPNQGGRRSAWVRNWTLWRYFREYFPIRWLMPELKRRLSIVRNPRNCGG
ncbi:diacylglycerol O-acyltransferase 2-like [Amblyraja radiata]|uniref:diacylglycerol O-acyltransferase 2-like n=1 Tax=Amblyraja radiata TaxID=386614 RepID=UPI0014036CC7|nr:diacylglycerol O-acyltransferase 2-like [Amblyraja radiata]